MLKAGLPLKLERWVAFEAFLDDVEMFFQESQNFGYNSTFGDDFFDALLFYFLCLDFTKQGSTLFLDQIPVHFTNRFDVIRLLLVKSIQKFKIDKIFVKDEIFKSTLFIK